uniref:Chemokine like factor n=2 Tax=Bos TaxID=9903 RepID=A0AAA9TYT5_BOVIN
MQTLKPKPKARPFCLSVKGHVKLLRLDIINSAVAAVFMIVVSVLALIPETTTHTVLGGVFGLAASVFCIADGALIYRKLLFNPGGPYQKTDAHDKLVL